MKKAMLTILVISSCWLTMAPTGCPINETAKDNTETTSGSSVCIPNAPSNLEITGRSETGVTIFWKDNSNDESGFKIERKSSGDANYSQIATVNANVISYTDTGLINNKTYCYRIKAYNIAGESLLSNEVSASTLIPAYMLPQVPRGFTATAVSPFRADLYWDYDESNNYDYELEQSINGSSFTRIASMIYNHPFYFISDLTPETTYYYRMRTMNSIGTSPYSNILDITTPFIDNSIESHNIITPQPNSYWITVSANSSSTIALMSDGSLWGWGDNYFGQLGLGADTSPQLVPVRIGKDNDWKAIAAGGGHTLALKQDGSLWAWGFNCHGQLGLGDRYSRYIPNRVGTDTDWKFIAAGSQSFAIKADGTLWAWGCNDGGRLGLGDEINRYVPTQVGTATNWSSVDCGNHSVGLKTDGTIWSWGDSCCGALGLGDVNSSKTPAQIGTDTNWKIISSGSEHNIALKTDSTLWAWGRDEALGLGDTIDRNVPVRVGTDDDWETISAGMGHSLAIKTNGTLWAWGYNCGQLGLGNFDRYLIPTQVGLDTDWLAIAAGSYHTAIIKKNKTLWMCGMNWDGRLGLGDNTDRLVPTQITTQEPPHSPPAAPSDLSAMVISYSQVNLSWVGNSDNEDGFIIERSFNGISFTQIATVGANTNIYHNTGLVESTTYYYRVRAYNTSGNSAYSNQLSATTFAESPSDPIPEAPSNLSATAVSSSQINLTWAYNPENQYIQHCLQWRDSSEVSFCHQTWIGSNTTSYIHTGLAISTTYYYRIKISFESGVTYSNVASTTTFEPPSSMVNAPSALSATSVSSSQINLFWVDNSSDEAGFKIERRTGLGGVYQLAAIVGPNITSYSNQELAENTTYYYLVRAYNSAGTDSAYSNEASATTFVYSPPDVTPTISGIASPSLNQEWTVGDINQIITWTTTAIVNPVDIYYSVKGDWTDTKPLALGVAGGIGTRYYSLPSVPDDVSSGYTVKIRICEASNHANYMDSGSFKIKASLGVVIPVVGICRVGREQIIQWVSNADSLSSVKLYYLKDAAPNYITTRPNIKGTNSYMWKVPDAAISDDVQIRIEEDNDSMVKKDGTVFKVKPELKITSPGATSGEAYTVGDPLTINWICTGTHPVVVNLEWDRNDANWQPLPNAINGSAGASSSIGYANISGTNWYAFAIPNDMYCQTVRIRIKHQTDNDVSSVSANTFKIRADFVDISVTGSLGLNIVKVGEIATINWTPIAQANWVLLTYSSDGINFSKVITPYFVANSGSYLWRVPNDIQPSCKIRITDFSDCTVSSTQVSSFKIRGYYHLDSPNVEFMVWKVGEAKTINWTTYGSGGGIGQVNVQWSKGDGIWTTFENGQGIIGVENGQASLSIIMPDAITSTFKVRMAMYSDSTIYDESDYNMTVKGKITVNNPDSSTTWYLGDPELITWTINGTMENVRLDYWDNPAGQWKQIVSSTPAKTLGNLGSYILTNVPDLNRDDVKIRVTQIGINAALSAEGESVVFKIRPKLQIICPPSTPGETFTVGQNVAIQWTYNSDSPLVITVSYLKDGNPTVIVITPCLKGTNSYLWTIPQEAVSDNIKIRLEYWNNDKIESAVFKVVTN